METTARMCLLACEKVNEYAYLPSKSDFKAF